MIPDILKWGKRQLDKLGSPELDWVQVEVTTRCNAACIYCPHTLLRKRWTDRDMPMGVFRRLIPFLKYTDLVYLQGWGEPLLNENLFEMIRICRDRGKRVGLTTNGMLLTDKTLQTLVDLKLDVLGISLAGTHSKTHNRIRKGTDLDRIISSLEALRTIKDAKETQRPSVHLAYLMLKSNFDELRKIVSLAKAVGAEQVVASNLTLILDPKLSAEAIFDDTGEKDYYRTTLEEIKKKAHGEKMVFEYHGPALDDTSLVCRENVRAACVISVGGEVIPCVLMDPVLSDKRMQGEKGPCHYIFKGQRLPLNSLFFGSIETESLTEIWYRRDYSAFRDLFAPRTTERPGQIVSQMPQCCVACYKRLGA